MEITCDGCGKKTSKSVAWVKSHDLFTCPFCDETSPIDEQARNTLAEGGKVMSTFVKGVEKGNKR